MNLIVGILIGVCLALGISFLLTNNKMNVYPERNNMQFQNRPNENVDQMNFEDGRGGKKNFEGEKTNMKIPDEINNSI